MVSDVLGASLPQLTFPSAHQYHGETEDGEEAEVALENLSYILHMQWGDRCHFAGAHPKFLLFAHPSHVLHIVLRSIFLPHDGVIADLGVGVVDGSLEVSGFAHGACVRRCSWPSRLRRKEG